MRQSTSEAPVYFRKRLLGFAESYGGSRSGVLEASDDVLRFREGDGPVFDWGLLDIRALQTSSSTVQITPRHGAMAQFRFVSDSPRRWEELICHLLSEAWLRAGRGRIVEFQPRIVVR
jgi:hypothetical protein